MEIKQSKENGLSSTDVNFIVICSEIFIVLSIGSYGRNNYDIINSSIEKIGVNGMDRSEVV